MKGTEVSELVCDYPETSRKVLELVRTARGNLIEAAKEYHQQTPEEKEKTRALFSEHGLLPNWTQFDRVGAGAASPKLLFWPPRLTKGIEGLSCDEQERLLKDGIDVVIDEAGTIRHLPLATLTSQQRKQVFNCDHVRSAIEQRAWLKNNEPRARVIKAEFAITQGKNGKVRLRCRDCGAVREITKAEILSWAQQIG